MEDLIFKVISDIHAFNARIGQSIFQWKVIPEMCYVYNSNLQTTTFVKEVMDWCRDNGTVDNKQSAEEAGAVGQCYLINGEDLLSHFGFELLKK